MEYAKQKYLDLFTNKNTIIYITNGLDKKFKTDYKLDVYDFLKLCGEKNV